MTGRNLVLAILILMAVLWLAGMLTGCAVLVAVDRPGCSSEVARQADTGRTTARRSCGPAATPAPPQPATT